MDFASAVEHSAQLRAKVSAMELALAANPHDKGLRITLLSAKRRAERSEQTLIEMAAQAQIDVCRYKVVRTTGSEYFASHLASSLITYQNLFTALYDFVKSGAKSAASYKNAIKQLSLLNLAYTFPGSMGVLLTIGADRDMFGEGELDRVIAAFDAVTDISSSNDVREVARDFGLNVIRKTYDWANFNSQADYAVDLFWQQSTSKIHGGVVSRQKFSRIAELINAATDEEPEELNVEGTLGTYSIISDTFAIISREGEVFKGRLAKDFPRREYKIPAVYIAKIRANTVVKYASESAETTYTLLSLTDIETGVNSGAPKRT